MVKKLLMLKLFKMIILNFKEFMKKYNLENDNLNESDLRRVYNYPIYPTDGVIFADRGFNNIDDGSQGELTGRVL